MNHGTITIRKTRWRNKQKSTNPKDLNESDINTFLDQYFEDFKHNLQNNNFEKMNMMLVNNVIDKFGMIFQLWDDNRIFQASVDKKRFENIHKSMRNVFDTGNDRSYEPIMSNDFTLECNHCGEAFPLRNKDCRYSYDLHAISKEHRDFVGNLNIAESGTRCNEEPESDLEIRLERITTQVENVLKITTQLHSSIIDTNGPTRKQNAKIVPSSSNPAPAVKKNKTTNKQISDLNTNPITVFDARCIIFKNNSLRCEICNVILSPKQNIIPHMKGKLHKTSTKQIEHGVFNMFVRKDKNEIYCTVCNGYSCKKLESFFQHCRSDCHVKKVKQSALPSAVISASLIQHEIAKVLNCPVPGCSISVSKLVGLMNHLQSIHQIN